MGGELFRDQVDLAVVQLLGHLLAEQEAVEHGIEAPEGGHGLLRLHLGVVGGRGHVLVLPYLSGKGGEGGAADLRIPLVLVIVLEEGVAQGIFLSPCLEGIELHVRQLGHIVDLVGGVEALGQGRQGALHLRMELVGLVPQHVLQVVLIVRGCLDGLPQDSLVLLHQLAVDEAQGAGDLREEAA